MVTSWRVNLIEQNNMARYNPGSFENNRENFSCMKRYFRRQIERHKNERNGYYDSQATTYTSRSHSANEISSQRTNGLNNERKQFCDDLNIIVGNVRHPRYATMVARAKTFETWPKRNICVEKLVEAGFVYTLKDDIVECFDCGGVLCDWPDRADPWEQHALAFRHCPHVRRSKGDQYIRKVQNETDDLYNDTVSSSAYHVIDVIKPSLNSEKYETTVRESIGGENSLESRVGKLTFDTPSIDNISRTLTEMNNETKESCGVAGECDDVNTDIDNLDTLREENRRLKEPVTCKICFDAIACIVTLPCGHMVSCFQCIPALTSCAVCRTPIKGTVRAMMAVHYSSKQFSHVD